MKIALVQSVWQPDPRDNLQHVLGMIDQACQDRSLDFVCLAEFFLGPAWYMPGQAHLRGVTDTTLTSAVFEQLSAMARKHRVHLVCGSVVEQMPDGRYCNTSVLLDRDGVNIGQANKIHPFANEAVSCVAGDTLAVHETEFGPIGIAVCSDFWIPETIRILALKGATTIFLPGGSLRQNLPAMINAFRATAYLSAVNMVYCGPVGKITGVRGNTSITVEFAGTSLIATPQGLLAQAPPDAAAVLEATLSGEAILALREANAHDDTWMGLGLRQPQAYGALEQDYVGLNRDLGAEISLRMRQITPGASAP
ncbi:carbon-nitrogen hydrolase family protein [Massilia genomosp. 1]|uniref:Carbon-nitrogen hydrolase family protein n=1 Tax=Massilia genomosp. 1 TaxID=2609280 RepID=A0ABX0MX23_9BURK|nr:carbon-nitrogen hydrolase family protein [Massilia genomosp. 1]NHZ64117.1 carbon-nitrogen hydrolase family protein [Massilia genomosp. 1]